MNKQLPTYKSHLVVRRTKTTAVSQDFSSFENTVRCSVLIIHDILFLSSTGVSCDKASFCRKHYASGLRVKLIYYRSLNHPKTILLKAYE